MKTRKLISVILILDILIILVVVLILAMQGNTTTTGENPDNVEGQSLTCKSHSIKYPVFVNNDTDARDLKITANFYDNKLSAISLEYVLFYNTEQQINASEAQNHAAMNIDFGKNGLSADSFNANYSKMTNAMKMLLYTTNNDFNITSSKYFMIEAHEKKDLPETINEFEQIYKSQGFSCSKSKK